jgi:hypothetical protein
MSLGRCDKILQWKARRSVLLFNARGKCPGGNGRIREKEIDSGGGGKPSFSVSGL